MSQNLQLTAEQEIELAEISQKMAWRVHRKIPTSQQSIWGVDDISQETILEILPYLGNYDKTKTFSSYISTALYNAGITLISKIWTDHKRLSKATRGLEVAFQSDEGDSVTVVRVNSISAEEQVIQDREGGEMAARVEALISSVKNFAARFGVPFDPNDPHSAAIRVCDTALNHLSDEEWKALSQDDRNMLSSWGKALQKQGLAVVNKSGEIKNKGITQMVRSLLQEGITTKRAIMKHLDQKGIMYKEDSLATVIYEQRQKEGIVSAERDAIKVVVEEIFDGGDGVRTLRGIQEELKMRGLSYHGSTVRSVVAQVHQEHDFNV